MSLDFSVHRFFYTVFLQKKMLEVDMKHRYGII